MAAMVLSGVTIRVRSQLGMWRIAGVEPGEPAGMLQKRIEAEKNIPIFQQMLSLVCFIPLQPMHRLATEH